tara:strand:- start:150 stop:1235 length:1086 start_codon:yes stop_codon:yes gene_type:complete
MVQSISNKSLIKTLTSQLNIQKEKLAKLQKELDDVVADTIEVECCGKKFDSKVLLDKHQKTKRCLMKRGIKHIECNRCHNKFFDGYTRLSDLMCSSNWESSSYKAHVDAGCHMYCPNPSCGVQFKTQYMFKTHDCGYVCPVVPIKKKPKFKVKAKSPEPKPEPKPLPVEIPAPEPVIKETPVKPIEKIIEVDEKPCYTVEQKFHEWIEGGKKYQVNTFNDKVFRHGEYVGNVENGIIVFDDASDDESEEEYDNSDDLDTDVDIEVNDRIIKSSDWGPDLEKPIRDVQYQGLTHHYQIKSNKLYTCDFEYIGKIIDNKVILLDELELEREPMTCTSTVTGKVTQLKFKNKDRINKTIYKTLN